MYRSSTKRTPADIVLEGDSIRDLWRIVPGDSSSELNRGHQHHRDRSMDQDCN